MARWWIIVAVLIAWLVRELIIWLGYSWIVGTMVGVAMILGLAAFLTSRRLRNR